MRVQPGIFEKKNTIFNLRKKQKIEVFLPKQRQNGLKCE